MNKHTVWMLPTLLALLVFVPRVTLGACDCQTKCDQAECPGYWWRLHAGLHLAYGAGGAFHEDGVAPGFRQYLEVAGALGPGRIPFRLGENGPGGSRATQALLLGASALWGMTLHPSYLLGEVGYAHGMLLSGFGAFIGMGARVFDSTAAPVFGVRAAYDILLVNVGLRALASFDSAPDISLCLTVGVGRY